MVKVSRKAYMEAMAKVGDAANWTCQNCGNPVKRSIDSLGHVSSKNKLTKEERLYMILCICPELHYYEHRKSRNLESNLCVQLFLGRFGNQKDFLRPLWDSIHAVNNCEDFNVRKIFE